MVKHKHHSAQKSKGSKHDKSIDMNAFVIPLLLEIMENKDQVTLLHSSRVQRIVHLLIPELIKEKIITKNEIPQLWVSAILHDIGKIFVKDEVLESEKILNLEDYNHIKNHPLRGYHLIKQFNLPRKIVNAVKHHHERWDGQRTGKYPGYPDGLKGEKIPLFARIIGIADAFDAMSFGRPYKEAVPFETVIKIIKENAGKQFDPQLAEIFVRTIKKDDISLKGSLL